MLQNKYRWLFFFSFHFSLSFAEKHFWEHSTADCVLCLYLFVLWSVRWCTLHINRSQAWAFKPQLDLLVLYQKLQVHLILELRDSKTTLRYLYLTKRIVSILVTVQHRLSHVFPSFSLCRSTSIVVPLSTSFHFLLYCSASFRHVPEPSIAYSCTLHRHVPSRDLPEGSFALSQLDGCCLYKGLAL